MKKFKKDRFKGKKCFICGKQAISNEHTPAKCFFPDGPKSKQIKVFSCKYHNQDTSKDDEYIRNIIVMSNNNNQTAFNIFQNKCMNSFRRRPEFLKSLIDSGIPTHINKNDEIKQTKAFPIEFDRFEKIMRKISYALFYHKNNSIWGRELIIVTDSLYKANIKLDELGEFVKKIKELIIKNNIEGKNPEVIKYHFFPFGDKNDQFLWMKFYDGFEVFAFPKENTYEPKI